jgi:hypothetical protein
MLALLVRRDMKFPDACVRMCMLLCIDEAVKTRKGSICTMNTYLKIERPPAVKVRYRRACACMRRATDFVCIGCARSIIVDGVRCGKRTVGFAER